MEKDVYAVLQLEAEEKEMQQSEAQVWLCGGLWPAVLCRKPPAAAPAGSALPKGCVCQTLSEPETFAAAMLCMSSDVGFTAAIFLLFPQISTAKRLLEKGKEALNHEPERSWFQTKEERKKEKSMLERSLKKLTTELPWNPVMPLLSLFPKELRTGTRIDT